MTYTLIDSEVLASSASSVTFSSIPADYRDLIVVAETTGSGGGATTYMRLNSDSGSNYSWVTMIGTGSSAVSAVASTTTALNSGVNADTTQRGLAVFQLMDYSATDKHKTALIRGNNAGAAVYAYAGRWANTSAITSVEVVSLTSNFASGSTFYLYGVAA